MITWFWVSLKIKLFCGKSFKRNVEWQAESEFINLSNVMIINYNSDKDKNVRFYITFLNNCKGQKKQRFFIGSIKIKCFKNVTWQRAGGRGGGGRGITNTYFYSVPSLEDNTKLFLPFFSASISKVWQAPSLKSLFDFTQYLIQLFLLKRSCLEAIY